MTEDDITISICPQCGSEDPALKLGRRKVRETPDGRSVYARQWNFHCTDSFHTVRTTVQVRGDSLVEIVGDILVTIDAANPFNCDTIAAKLLEGLESCGVEVRYEQ